MLAQLRTNVLVDFAAIILLTEQFDTAPLQRCATIDPAMMLTFGSRKHVSAVTVAVSNRPDAALGRT